MARDIQGIGLNMQESGECYPCHGQPQRPGLGAGGGPAPLGDQICADHRPWRVRYGPADPGRPGSGPKGITQRIRRGRRRGAGRRAGPEQATQQRRAARLGSFSTLTPSSPTCAEPSSAEVAGLLRDPTLLTAVNAAEVCDEMVRVFGDDPDAVEADLALLCHAAPWATALRGRHPVSPA